MIPILLVFGCTESPISGVDTGMGEVPWADEVIEAAGDASLAINGARGLGQHQGSLDVYSLSLNADDALIVGWSGAVLTDGPGVDFTVFENAFDYGENQRFMDLIVVSVSANGTDFVEFPHTYLSAEPEEWSSDPADWQGFAGMTPVLLNEDTNLTDPFDPVMSGGDGFDLADLPAGDPVADDVVANGVVAVRMVSAVGFPTDPVSNGADVDAVYGRYLER